MTKNKVKLRLQGHEKFALREGWINKGLMLIPRIQAYFQNRMHQMYLALEIIWLSLFVTGCVHLG